MGDTQQTGKRLRAALAASGQQAFDSIPSMMLAEGLLSGRAAGATTIGLTAMKSGSGVTSVTAGLAAALAREANERVLVVEASEAAPGFKGLLRLNTEPVHLGRLETYVAEDTEAVPAVQAGPMGYDIALLTGVPGLIPQPGLLAWWGRVKQRYTIVLADLGPLQTGSPVRWNGILNQFVLVLDASRDTLEMATALRDNQDFSKLPFKGFIINKREYHVPSFLYRMLA